MTWPEWWASLALEAGWNAAFWRYISHTYWGAPMLIPKLVDPDSCCVRPTATSIAKTYGGRWSNGMWVRCSGADGGADVRSLVLLIEEC
jgi:hypothetical protein